MKRRWLLALVLALCLTCSLFLQTAAAASAFQDVPDGAYYADAVEWAVGRQITNGTAPTTFSPDDTCTRAHIVTFLYRAA